MPRWLSLVLMNGVMKCWPCPEREDRRLLRLDDFIDVWRIEAEFVGQPDQPQELGREKPHSALTQLLRSTLRIIFFQGAGFVS